LPTQAYIDRLISLSMTDITHIAIGTGASPGATATDLDGEALRKTATKFVDQNTLICEGFWDESEGNGQTYTNTAVFGNGATDELGTGELFEGGAISVPKDSTQSLTVSIEITIEAVT
jgi:hypothetical protein